VKDNRQDSGSPRLSEDDFELVRESVLALSVRLSLPGVSLSLVSGAPAEIFHAWLDTITLEVEAGSLEKTLQLEGIWRGNNKNNNTTLDTHTHSLSSP